MNELKPSESDSDMISDIPAAVREPTIEQFVYYLRFVEGDDQEWRIARRRAFQMELNSLAAHLEKMSGRPLRREASSWEPADPYVSQRVASLGWVFAPHGRACYAEARTCSDAYCLHIRYYRRGLWPTDVYARMRQEDMWQPWQEEQLLGQSLCLAGIAHPEEGHAIAAQILRRQRSRGQGIGELQTCGLNRARIYRGSTYPDLSVFLYTRDGAEWAVGTFLDRWLSRWEFHRHKLSQELAWCEGVATSIEEKAVRLREAVRSDDLHDNPSRWAEPYANYESLLAVCLSRENAMQNDLQSLEWLLAKLEIEGPDTYFAALLRGLRSRRQQWISDLEDWQGVRDEAARAMSATPGAPAQSLALARGDFPRARLESQDLVAARQLPVWPGRGCTPAAAIYDPDDRQALPSWSGRPYDDLSFVVDGPGRGDSYRLRTISSTLGEQRSILISPWKSLDQCSLAASATAEQATISSVSACGEALFRALVNGGREEVYRQALTLARANGRGLRWRLAIEDAPELDVLPWEHLYDPAEGVYLASSAETPFARFVAGSSSAHPRPINLPLRILAAVAAPKGTEERYSLLQPKVEEEIEVLRAALRPLVETSLLKLEIAARASIAEIRRAAARFHPHVFHLIAHGVLRHDVAYALLESETAGGRLANERVLHEFCLDDEETGLALLCPPEAARQESIQALAGLARRLNRFGSRAVIGFQQAFPVKLKKRFWSEFYGSLASGNAADVALAETRRRLMMESDSEDPAWGAPVLSLPSLSGRIFRPQSKA